MNFYEISQNVISRQTLVPIPMKSHGIFRNLLESHSLIANISWRTTYRQFTFCYFWDEIIVSRCQSETIENQYILRYQPSVKRPLPSTAPGFFFIYFLLGVYERYLLTIRVSCGEVKGPLIEAFPNKIGLVRRALLGPVRSCGYAKLIVIQRI